MRNLWGNLSICPILDHMDLPYHMAGELLSISRLKVWGDTQKPQDGMAYLLVKVEDASEVEGYSMALVWISPYQAQVPTMVEALEILSTCASSGPNWPYIVTQLYEGTNHVPLPKDKHFGVLSQGKAESPCGWISQLEVCQLLSTRLQVIYPVGLNGGDQSVIIDLPGPLHGSSSVTTNKHPYMKITIPSPNPEEQDGANPPLGRGHIIQTITMPKTPWKPRVTLLAEVCELLTWSMTEDYDREPEHSTMEKELTTEADISPPPKMGVPVLPLDTSSQASVPETEACIESNPIHDSPTAGANCSHRDSPTMDLLELQANAHLAINHMLSIERSSELERQQVIQDFEASLHQWEAKAAGTNERAKIVFSRQDLQARVKCTKAVMRAKHDYRVAVQEARAVHCNKLEEAEAAYLEALCKNAATWSLHCTTLCMEHAKYMSELEGWALEAENRSWQDFLSAHLSILHHAPPCLKEDPHSSYTILLGNSSSSLQSVPSVRAPQARGNYLQLLLPSQNPNSPNNQKGGILCQIYRETCP